MSGMRRHNTGGRGEARATSDYPHIPSLCIPDRVVHGAEPQTDRYLRRAGQTLSTRRRECLTHGGPIGDRKRHADRGGGIQGYAPADSAGRRSVGSPCALREAKSAPEYNRRDCRDKFGRPLIRSPKGLSSLQRPIWRHPPNRARPQSRARTARWKRRIDNGLRI